MVVINSSQHIHKNFTACKDLTRIIKNMVSNQSSIQETITLNKLLLMTGLVMRPSVLFILSVINHPFIGQRILEFST